MRRHKRCHMAKAILSRVKSVRHHTIWSQTILRSYNAQISMVLPQKQTSQPCQIWETGTEKAFGKGSDSPVKNVKNWQMLFCELDASTQPRSPTGESKDRILSRVGEKSFFLLGVGRLALLLPFIPRPTPAPSQGQVLVCSNQVLYTSATSCALLPGGEVWPLHLIWPMTSEQKDIVHFHREDLLT